MVGCFFVRTDGGNRTPTSKILDPKSSASTNSATSATKARPGWNALQK